MYPRYVSEVVPHERRSHCSAAAESISICKKRFNVGNEVFVDDSVDREDYYFFKNVFNRNIITSDVHPLIFDGYSNHNQYLSSFKFYMKITDDISIYNNLSDEERLVSKVGLRDLYEAYIKGYLTSEEELIVKNVIKVIPDDSQVNFTGLYLSFYPTQCKVVMKNIKMFKESFDPTLESLFLKGLNDNDDDQIDYIAFVDITDISYHNFENMLDLDRYLEKKDLSNITSTKISKVENIDIYELTLSDTDNILLSLDNLNLYEKPFNSCSRGGKRFIFKSNKLSELLIKCIKLSPGYTTDNKQLFNNLQRVNNVFRYNKFSPNDKKFESHYDTPYHDGEYKEYSKYTMIIYLTTGSGNPVLRIDTHEYMSINKYKCIIFDQKYEHEGLPYIDNDKIFIRTELIFFDNNLVYDPEISKIFNISCYLTIKSLFDDELKKYMNESFEHTAKLRCNINEDFKYLYFHNIITKNKDEITFITNGNDYYFLKINNTEEELRRISLVVLLDYFNGKHIHTSENIIKNISKFNNQQLRYKNNRDIYNTLINYKLANLKINQENINIEILNISEDVDIPRLDSAFLNLTSEDLHLDEVRSSFEYKKDTYNEIIEPFSIIIFEGADVIIDGINKKSGIYIDTSDLKIDSSKIYFDTKGLQNRINFAGGMGRIYNPYEDIFEDRKIKCIGYTLPPINYSIDTDGYHLSLDMFNNGFIRPQKLELTIPFLRDEYLQV